jgi:hypothetical protein
MICLRTFALPALLSLLGACGGSLPENSPPAGSPREGLKEPDIRPMETHTLYPQQQEEFATHWFWRTRARIFNPNAVQVTFSAWCSRYSYNVSGTIESGGSSLLHAPCEGTALYIFNNAPPAPPGTPSYILHASTW